MFTHFSGNGPRSEPKYAARHCSECEHELYADEELICQECLKIEEQDQVEEE